MPRYPAPLRPGDRIGVTAPSSGVAADLMPRFEVCVASLRDQGYDVEVGGCLDGTTHISGTREERADRADGDAHRPRDPGGVPAVGRRRPPSTCSTSSTGTRWPPPTRPG